MKAFLKNYRQSPRKVRLVADAIKGKAVTDAFSILNFMPKRASEPITKLLSSAVANAKNANNLSPENLFLKDVRVDTAVVLKRSMPRARGSAYPIKKRSSHVTLLLEEKVAKPAKVKAKAVKK